MGSTLVTFIKLRGVKKLGANYLPESQQYLYDFIDRSLQIRSKLQTKVNKQLEMSQMVMKSDIVVSSSKFHQVQFSCSGFLSIIIDLAYLHAENTRLIFLHFDITFPFFSFIFVYILREVKEYYNRFICTINKSFLRVKREREGERRGKKRPLNQ